MNSAIFEYLKSLDAGMLQTIFWNDRHIFIRLSTDPISQYGQTQSQYKWKIGDKCNSTKASKYVPKRPIICINWNLLFGTKIYLVKVPLSVSVVKKIYFIRNVRVLIRKFWVIINCQAYCVCANQPTVHCNINLDVWW